MNVLLLGGGGREHALALSLARSPRQPRLFAMPGNPGIAEVATLVPGKADDVPAVLAAVAEHAIAFVVVGPEAPLVAGVVDALAEAGVPAFGPSAAAAQLEGSKIFTKELCALHGIPTAAFQRFKEVEAAKHWIRARNIPVVVKADGLAAGKGVAIGLTIEDAMAAVDHVAALAAPGELPEFLVEEFLTGEEASLFCLVDGETVIPFGSAQDHKRAFDGDEGPNTGGMGAYAPAPVATPEIERRAIEEIVRPTARALKKLGTPYKGILYAGLMITAEGPKLIEYNVRFGDPEAQVLLPRLRSDLLEIMLATVEDRLEEVAVEFHDLAALTVVLATRGYPGPYASGSEIRGLARAAAIEGVTVFHAGTRRDGDRILAAGGRVLNVTGTGATLAEARARAYAGVDAIDWPEGFCRRDIGWRALGG